MLIYFPSKYLTACRVQVVAQYLSGIFALKDTPSPSQLARRCGDGASPLGYRWV